VVTVFNRTKTVMSFSKNIMFCSFIAPQTLNYLDFQSFDFEHIYLVKVIPETRRAY